MEWHQIHYGSVSIEKHTQKRRKKNYFDEENSSKNDFKWKWKRHLDGNIYDMRNESKEIT